MATTFVTVAALAVVMPILALVADLLELFIW